MRDSPSALALAARDSARSRRTPTASASLSRSRDRPTTIRALSSDSRRTFSTFLRHRGPRPPSPLSSRRRPSSPCPCPLPRPSRTTRPVASRPSRAPRVLEPLLWVRVDVVDRTHNFPSLRAKRNASVFRRFGGLRCKTLISDALRQQGLFYTHESLGGENPAGDRSRGSQSQRKEEQSVFEPLRSNLSLSRERRKRDLTVECEPRTSFGSRARFRPLLSRGREDDGLFRLRRVRERE